MHPTIEAIQKGNLKKVPEVRTGYTVEVSQKVKEGTKERVQKFQGLVIKVSHGAGVEKTFTVRKIVEGIGVEKIFPFHSSNIVKIHVVKKAKVRRQKLYYMRNRFGKSARLSERHVTDEERAKEEEKMEALYNEAVKAEESKKAKEEEKDSANTSNDSADEAKKESSEESVKVEDKEPSDTSKVEDSKKEESLSEDSSESEDKENEKEEASNKEGK